MADVTGRPGFGAAVGGAIAGGIAGGALGGAIGMAYSVVFMPNAELEGLFPFVVGVGIGSWAGAALGSFGALRLRRAARAGSTAKWTAALFAPAVVAGFFLGIGLEKVHDVLFFLGLALPPLVVVPVIARLVALGSSAARSTSDHGWDRDDVDRAPS